MAALFESGSSALSVLGAEQIDVRSLPVDPWAIATGVGQVLAALVALVGLYLIYQQVKGAREAAKTAADEARRDRTAIVHAHWGDRHFRRMLSPVYAFLDATTVSDCLVQIEGWQTARHAEARVLPRVPPDHRSPSACKNDVVHVLSFYEDICQRFNLGELDRLSLATSIGFQLTRQFATAAWFIYWQRATRGQFLYTEWQQAIRDLCDDIDMWPNLRLHRELLGILRGFDPSPQVRVLCVPPLDSAVDHRSAERLSLALANKTALSDPVAQDALRDGIASDALQDAAGWNVVLLPESLRAGTANAKPIHTLAFGVAERLKGVRDPAQVAELANSLEQGQSFAAVTG